MIDSEVRLSLLPPPRLPPPEQEQEQGHENGLDRGQEQAEMEGTKKQEGRQQWVEVVAATARTGQVPPKPASCSRISSLSSASDRVKE